MTAFYQEYIDEKQLPGWQLFFCLVRRQTMTFLGREISILADADMVVYLCAHGAYDGWDRVGAVLGLAEYIQARPDLDWDLVLGRADALRVRRMLLVGVFLAADLFGVAKVRSFNF